MLHGGNTQLLQLLFCSPPSLNLALDGQTPGDSRDPVNHSQQEKLKAKNHCWPTLHQCHLLTTGFNLLIGLQ